MAASAPSHMPKVIVGTGDFEDRSMSQPGYIKVHRCIWDSQVSSDAEALRCFLRIVSEANWKEGWFEGQKVLRGQWVTSRDAAGKLIGISPFAFLRLLKKLEKWGCVSVETSNKRTTITVCKYDTYQASELPPRTTTAQQPHNDRTTAAQRPHTIEEGIRRVEGQEGEDIGAPATPSPTPPTVEDKPKRGRKPMPPFVPPTLEEVREYAKQSRTPFNADKFFDHFAARGWISGRTPLVDWRAALRNWARTERERNPNAWQSQFKMMSEIPGAKPQ